MKFSLKSEYKDRNAQRNQNLQILLTLAGILDMPVQCYEGLPDG